MMANEFPNTCVEFFQYLENKSDIEILFILQERYLVKPFKNCFRCDGKAQLRLDPTDPIGGRIECEICNQELFARKCSQSHRSRMWLRKVPTDQHNFSLCYQCPSCKTQKSCFTDSYFEKSRLPIRKILLLMFCWSANFSVGNTRAVLPVNKNTVVQWFQYCRDIASTKLLSMNGQSPTGGFQIGGVGHIIAIDECMISKRKYNRGRLSRQLWVFGMIDCNTGIFILEYVENRTKETLLPIIRKHCAPGSTIWSDEWRAYNQIPNLTGCHFTHATVNHSLRFKDPITGVCTNRIEGTWGVARRFYRGKATNAQITPENISSYLDEFMWRQFYHIPYKPGETLNFLLCHLAEWKGLD